jgi:hypothetical protein
MTHEFLAYQIIILCVSLVLILRTFILMIQGKKNFRELIIAIVIWGAFSALALFPNLSITIAHLLGFEVGINFILTITTIILFAAVIQLIVKTDKSNSAVTQLVRQIALQDLKNSTN